jgi:hypothetical protein
MVVDGGGCARLRKSEAGDVLIVDVGGLMVDGELLWRERRKIL